MRLEGRRAGWLWAAALALAVAAVSWWSPTAGPTPGESYARLEIGDVGFERLERLRRAEGVRWWVELDRSLLVLASHEALERLEREVVLERLEVAPRPERLYLLRRAHGGELAGAEVDLLALGGRHAVLQARGDDRPQLPAGAGARLLPLRRNAVLARSLANEPPEVQARRRRGLSPAAAGLAAGVDPQRWYDDVVALASFNRYTHGSEVDDARDWIVQTLEKLPGLMVTTESFQVGGTTAWNVVATLAGSGRPDDWYLVGAHYDAISQNPNAAAPGAEDNASGCAGVIELARLLTAQPPEGTVVFLCYSGEEQGLYGSVDHASGLVASGDADKVKAALNMDMIGYTADADLDCLLESSSSFSGLIDVFAAAAAGTELRIVTSFFPFGSDHVPYINRGIPALLTIENDWAIYPDYHRTTDVPANVSLEMGGEVLRMNAAAIAELAGAAAPVEIFSDGFESGDTSFWLGVKD